MELALTKEKYNMLDLKKTFTCGQCFRWLEEPDGSFTGVVNGKIYNLKQGDKIPKELESYMDMDTDYDKINNYLASRDQIIKEAISVGEGIHILRQEFWETVVSFIISQNNNIPRIMGCIENLAKLAGDFIGTYDGPNGEHIGKEYYTLPSPEKLASMTVADLAPVRLGYRAPYLIKAAQEYLEDKDRELLSFTGVGPKVANCIDLFGKHNLDSFPIDVWVKRVMNRLYDIPEDDVKSMHKFADQTFAPYGGIAQQYLFYFIRDVR